MIRQNVIDKIKLEKLLQGSGINKVLMLHTLPFLDVSRTISFITKTLPDAQITSMVGPGDIEEISKSEIIKQVISCDIVHDLTFKINPRVIKDIRARRFDLVVVPVDTSSSKEFKRADAIALLSRARLKLKLFVADQVGIKINLLGTLWGWSRYYLYCGYRLLRKACRYLSILVSGFFILVFLVPFMFVFLNIAIKIKKKIRERRISG